MSAKNINKNNINYFKKKDQVKLVGGGLLIVGLFMLWLRFGMLSWILAPVFVPVGLGLFLYGSITSSSENDIDAMIEKNSTGLEVDFSEDRHYNKRVINEIAPKIAEGYEYVGDDLMFRRDKKGTWRSSKYTKYIIYVLTDELYINRRTISLISDEVDQKMLEVPYNTIDIIELKDVTNSIVVGKNTFNVKKSRFVITVGGKEVFSAPMNNDIKSEEYVEMLNKMVAKSKESKE